MLPHPILRRCFAKSETTSTVQGPPLSLAALQSRVMPFMSLKLPLPTILSALSDLPADSVTEAYDALTLEVFDLNRVLEAAA
jgi:hypothetical protein